MNQTPVVNAKKGLEVLVSSLGEVADLQDSNDERLQAQQDQAKGNFEKIEIEAAKKLNAIAHSLGLGLIADQAGMVFPGTNEKIAKVQEYLGISSDGIIGKQTIDALAKSDPYTLDKSEASNARVQALSDVIFKGASWDTSEKIDFTTLPEQRKSLLEVLERVNKNKFISKDNINSENLTEIVKEIQQRLGLKPPDGIIGRETALALLPYVDAV
jgi:murein L,D-transpeptidase YcbB/YkuD